jgi:TIGR03009 family protein
MMQGLVSGQQTPPVKPGGQPAQPPQPTMTPEQQMVLDHVLQTWEADAKGLQSIYVQFLITQKDVTFGVEDKSFGEAKVLKLATGAYGLRLDVYALDSSGTRGDPNKLKQRIICTGNWIYTFDLAAKLIHARQVMNVNMKPDDGPFAFIFGMQAVDAKKRFEMLIAKQEKDWTWIQVRAKEAQDQKDFTVANVGVINQAFAVAPKFFPLIIQWREPNGNIQSWHFQSVIRNDGTKVGPMDFSIEEDKKRGWQVRIVPNEGALQKPNPANPAGGVVPTGANAPRK